MASSDAESFPAFGSPPLALHVAGGGYLATQAAQADADRQIEADPSAVEAAVADRMRLAIDDRRAVEALVSPPDCDIDRAPADVQPPKPIHFRGNHPQEQPPVAPYSLLAGYNLIRSGSQRRITPGKHAGYGMLGRVGLARQHLRRYGIGARGTDVGRCGRGPGKAAAKLGNHRKIEHS